MSTNEEEEAAALLDEFELEDSRASTLLAKWTRHTLKPRPFGVRRIVYNIAIFFVFTLVIIFIVLLIGSGDYALSDYSSSGTAYRLNPQTHRNRPPTTLSFNWTITTGVRAPDGVDKLVYLVNGEFPGPTIESRSGDRLIINVHNSLDHQGVSLHWHGLRLQHQNLMDGAVGFTQCPIPPGKSFAYNFTIGDDEHGTFWWHSHSELQRADGLWGGLVVHSPEEELVDREEHLLMIGDWFHREQRQVLADYTDASSRGNEPVPDSLLVNGHGRFDCSRAVPARPVNCSSIAVSSLRPLLETTGENLIRLRVVNVGSIAGFTIGVSNGTMTPVRVDGGFRVHAEPSENIGILYPGERVDLDLGTSPMHSQSDLLTIALDEENFKYPNPALEPVQRFPMFNPSSKLAELSQTQKQQIKNEIPALHPERLKAATKATGMPEKAEQLIVLYAKMEKLAHLNYEPVGFINHTSWKPQTPPLLGLNASAWDKNQFVPPISSPSNEPVRVDIVINNLDDGAHPFHLHGHQFYIMSSYKEDGRGGWGSYDALAEDGFEREQRLEFQVRKDTVSVPRRGYVIISFLADNPGIWALHCHMLVHMARGMMMGLHVSPHGHQALAALDDRANDLCIV